MTLLNLSAVVLLTAVVAPAIGTIPPMVALCLYFVPVLATTLLWNFEQGMIAAFAAALGAEFFYFEPRFSLAVAGWRNIMALLIFLAVALLASYLLDEIRRVRASAADRVRPQGAASAAPALHFGGATRTVPERIAEFLLAHEHAMYCDQCIQDQLGLKWRQQVQLVTATLAVTMTFRRVSGHCQHCNQPKQVIQYINTQ